MENAYFLCKNIGIGENLMLFNLYNFNPHYLSASDGIFIEELKEMSDDAISEPVFPTVPANAIPEPDNTANGQTGAVAGAAMPICTAG